LQTKVQQAKAEKAKAKGLTQTTSALGQAFSFKKKGGAHFLKEGPRCFW
jgi:hypothetical protein